MQICVQEFICKRSWKEKHFELYSYCYIYIKLYMVAVEVVGEGKESRKREG